MIPAGETFCFVALLPSLHSTLRIEELGPFAQLWGSWGIDMTLDPFGELNPSSLQLRCRWLRFARDLAGASWQSMGIFGFFSAYKTALK